MGRADWMAVEREFNRREVLLEDHHLGQARWSKWSHGGDECHAIEFGWKFRFDICGGPRTKGIFPDFWHANSRDGSLGEFPTFEAAALACEHADRIALIQCANTTFEGVLVRMDPANEIAIRKLWSAERYIDTLLSEDMLPIERSEVLGRIEATLVHHVLDLASTADDISASAVH